MRTPSREYSDEALMSQIGAFLTYRSRGGSMCFAEWADGKDFAPSDRTFLEVAYMGTYPDGPAA